MMMNWPVDMQQEKTQTVLTKELGFSLRRCVSEICVKQIHINQGVGVLENNIG